MKFVWSYHLVVLCTTVTSTKIIDFLGNSTGFQDNLISDVKDEKVVTPPTTSGLIIDSNGYPGNSNEEIIDTIKTEDLPPFFKEILKALFSSNEMSKYDINLFTREDIINVKNSELCKIMCKSGKPKPPCHCQTKAESSDFHGNVILQNLQTFGIQSSLRNGRNRISQMLLSNKNFFTIFNNMDSNNVDTLNFYGLLSCKLNTCK